MPTRNAANLLAMAAADVGPKNSIRCIVVVGCYANEAFADSNLSATGAALSPWPNEPRVATIDAPPSPKARRHAPPAAREFRCDEPSL